MKAKGTSKLLLIILVLLATVFVLAACGDDDGDDTTTTAAIITDTTAAITDTTAGITDTTAAGGAAEGADVFAANCAGCHGDEGAGGANPNCPTLQGREGLTADRVENQVRTGGANGEEGMPGFEGKISDDEIAAVVDYVVNDVAPQ